MNGSAVDIRQALDGADYPCSKGELLARASTNEAGPEVKKALNTLPGGAYDDVDAVLAALDQGRD